jgi:hypothetical protein
VKQFFYILSAKVNKAKITYLTSSNSITFYLVNILIKTSGIASGLKRKFSFVFVFLQGVTFYGQKSNRSKKLNNFY